MSFYHDKSYLLIFKQITSFMPPKVTLTMASYSHEAFVAETVRNVLEQSYKDFELIIIEVI